MYVKINEKRFQTAAFSSYSGKHTQGSIQVDCEAPSKYHKLKTDYQAFSGVEQWEIDNSKKKEIIELLEARIDKQTDETILTGFVYDGNSYYLSLENQMNFKALNDIRDSLTYPVRVKHQTGYAEMQTAADYHSFYLAGMAYIQQKINEGWNEKDNLQTKTIDELITLLEV